MVDLLLQYRACGAECRDDWLRMLAHENGLPVAAVQRMAERLGEREDFGELVCACECRDALLLQLLRGSAVIAIAARSVS